MSRYASGHQFPRMALLLGLFLAGTSLAQLGTSEGTGFGTGGPGGYEVPVAARLPLDHPDLYVRVPEVTGQGPFMGLAVLEPWPLRPSTRPTAQFPMTGRTLASDGLRYALQRWAYHRLDYERHRRNPAIPQDPEALARAETEIAARRVEGETIAASPHAALIGWALATEMLDRARAPSARLPEHASVAERYCAEWDRDLEMLRSRGMRLTSLTRSSALVSLENARHQHEFAPTALARKVAARWIAEIEVELATTDAPRGTPGK